MARRARTDVCVSGIDADRVDPARTQTQGLGGQAAQRAIACSTAGTTWPR